eukprot:TRINITY_DN3964_c0_g1_i2.p2 TRINITY_DN3964_c0_g1~~TRINITY_DN3964_c0_g1_i2.p2  ORF type:complete len:161 (-),score=30.87 TRINITY_DN3964_c0_g1_i2:34-516(-)
MIPILKKNTQPRACIAMLSSGLAFMPSCFYSVYAGSKRFDDVLAYSLAAELAPYLIDVTSVVPNLVSTNMSGYTQSSALIADPEYFGMHVVQKLGVIRVAPNPFHDFQNYIGNALPESFVMNGFRNRMLHMKEAKRAQQRQANRHLHRPDNEPNNDHKLD